jgi:zinc protease
MQNDIFARQTIKLMGSKKLLPALLALLIAFQAAAQTKLIEKVVKKGNEVVIPYEKHQLPNGLTVIVHEDHSDPAVFVQVTYHVGSAREQEGRSGFAHFFEHMMFQGSEHVGDDEHFKILTAAGASAIDGQTNRDQTRYLQLVPSNQLETVLWLESDRMGYLLDSVTQAKFEIQRATVKNERQQNFENQSYGLMLEKIWQGLYPEGHPYSWPIIGYLADLDRVDVTDLKKFFLRWYTPNNATLTIAGDVQTADVIKMVENYFGSIERGPAVVPQIVAPVALTQDRYISYEDNNISTPQLGVWYPTVPFHHPDEAALDALAFIMGGSKSSLFEKKLVTSGLVPYVNISHPTYELAGEWAIIVRGFQDAKLSTLDSLTRIYLNGFEKMGFTDEDLQMFKANYEAPLINSLEGVQGKGVRLSEDQVYAGNPNYIEKDLQRYRAVTKDDVMRVYNKYIKNKPAVYLSIYPKGKSNLISKPNNFTLPNYTIDTPERAEYKNLVYKKPVATFDRSQKPSISTTPVVKIPDYWTERFNNGLKITGTLSNEVPTVAIQFNIEAGHRYETKEQAGVAQLLIGLLNESTEKYPSEELSNKLNLLGSIVKIESDGQDIIVTVSTLTKNIDATLALVEEMLLHPKFDIQEFDQVKKQQLGAIDNQLLQPRSLANNAFSKLLYGKDHVMSIPAVGTKESVIALTLQDVKNYYAKNFSPQVSSIVIVGDMSKETAISKLTAFKNWKSTAVVHPKEPALPVIDKTRIYFVNKPQAPQSEIRIGYLALPYDAMGEFYKAKTMNHVLGAELTSRININLREVHGYTYYSRSYFNGNKFIGPYAAFAGVRTNATDDAVVQFMKEIKNYADNGIKEEELKETKTAVAQREVLLYETPVQKAIFLKRIMDYGLDKNYTTKQSELLKSLTKADVDAIAKKYLPYNTMDIVVVGDKIQVFEKLKGLGYEVVELDVNGEPVRN